VTTRRKAIVVRRDVEVAVHREEPHLEVRLLVELCRALIRENPSRDFLEIGLAIAKHATGASDEEMMLLARAVMGEAEKSPWPKGFF
jgi:hypothetical protein